MQAGMIRLERGFSLVELLVAITIMGILLSLIYVNFQQSRASTRDKIRQTTLADLKLAIEQYRAQTGAYPVQGCGSPDEWVTSDSIPSDWEVDIGAAAEKCTSGTDFIAGLVPSYIQSLPNPARAEGRQFYYRTDTDRTAYKLIVYDAVEVSRNYIASFNDRFAPCPPQAAGGGSPFCAGVVGVPNENRTYAVYSPGAEGW